MTDTTTTPLERVEAYLNAAYEDVRNDIGPKLAADPDLDAEMRERMLAKFAIDTVGDATLRASDLRALIEKARTLEVVDLARVAVKAGDTLLVRPTPGTGFFDRPTIDEIHEYLESEFPGVKVVVLAAMADVAVVVGEAAADG
jgi:hypothetical protein